MALTGNLYSAKVSVTDVNSALTPVAAVTGAQSKYIEEISIYNAGANAVFLGLGEAATTAKAEIAAGATLAIKGRAAAVATVNLICAAGLTSTAYLYVSLARH